MGRREWLQELRMQKSESVLDRVRLRSLSQLQAAEILGTSERAFRRWRDPRLRGALSVPWLRAEVVVPRPATTASPPTPADNVPSGRMPGGRTDGHKVSVFSALS